MFNESVAVRFQLIKTALNAFLLNPIIGVGLNNSITFSPILQPVHNLCLLVLVETGIIGILIFYFGINYMLSKIINKYFLFAIIFVLLTGIVDHYWFTLVQNQLVLSLLIGLSLNRNVKNIL
jgi:O-antigen ligase